MFPPYSIMYEGMGLAFNQTHQPLNVPWCWWCWLFRLMLVASKLVFEESLVYNLVYSLFIEESLVYSLFIKESLVYSLFIYWKSEALRLMLWILDLWLTNSLLDDWWLLNDVIWYYGFESFLSFQPSWFQCQFSKFNAQPSFHLGWKLHNIFRQIKHCWNSLLMTEN